jgi:hypothetical protein
MRSAITVLGLLGLTTGIVTAVATGGCDSGYVGPESDAGKPGNGTEAGTDSPSGTSGEGGTLGIGKACSSSANECRNGLACSKGVCEPSHAVAAGSPCVLDDSCKRGLACVDGVCVTGVTAAEEEAGIGVLTASCMTDANCETGLRCDIVGLGAECEPEGTGDIGATCTTGSSCLGGLACLAGKCATPLPEVPPALGTLWPGVTCKDITGPTTAYFSVPGGTDDADFYRLPFPNDIRLVNGKPNVADHPTPGAGVLGYDIVARYLSAIDSDNDGWGAYETVFFRFSNTIDTSSFSSTGSIHVVDLTTGQEQGWQSTYSSAADKYICGNWVGVRPPQGQPYTPGHTIVAYTTTTIKANGGGAIAVASDFKTVMSTTQPTGNTSLAAAWTAYVPFRAYLAAQTPVIPTSSLLSAAVFTVGHIQTTIPALASAVASAAVPTATHWTLCTAGATSPCPQNTGTRGCPATPDPNFDELQALVTLPIFQNGTEPYLNPPDGNIIVSGGAATLVRSEQVCMSLSIPHGASSSGDAGGTDAGSGTGGIPTIVFAHGTGGSYRDQVNLGIAHDFAVGVNDGSGTMVKAALLGIDQVENGTRTGSSTESPNDLFFNFSNPNAALGNPQQGSADQLSLLQFVTKGDFTAAAALTSAGFTLSGANVGFWGHSQGATEGSLSLPYSGYAGAVFSGQGASLMDALLTKTNPVNIAAAVPIALEDVNAQGALPGGIYHPVLSLLQLYIDPADPLNFADLMAAVPPTGITPHHVFQPYGQMDTYAPPVTEATYALAAQLGLVANSAVAKPDPIGGLTATAPPASGNLTVGTSTVTALVREYTPSSSYDGHFVSFDNATARADVERFLAQVLEGKVPQVGQ